MTPKVRLLRDENGMIEDEKRLMQKMGISQKYFEAIKSKYKIKEEIGKGAYGSVYRGVCKISNRQVALKILNNRLNSEYDYVKVIREI